MPLGSRRTAVRSRSRGLLRTALAPKAKQTAAQKKARLEARLAKHQSAATRIQSKLSTLK